MRKLKTSSLILLMVVAVIVFYGLLHVSEAQLPVFWGSATGFQSRGVTFSQLSVPYSATAQTGVPQSNGTHVYCSDCQADVNKLCVGSGPGADAFRVNGAWICGFNAGVVSVVPPFKGILNPMDFGAKCDGATDDSAAIQLAINNAYTGTNNEAIWFPPSVQCNFLTGLDAKGVAIFGFNGGSNNNFPATTLHYTGTSGIAIAHAGRFEGVKLTGLFTAAGDALNASISAISESGHIVTVVTGTNTLVQGAGVIISGTTNYNGAWRVATIIGPTSFTFKMAATGLGTESAGAVHYYPTVGIQHLTEGTNYSCCDVKYSDLQVSGFGVGIDLSAAQTIAGSTDNWSVKDSSIARALIGVQALGNTATQDSAQPHANVSAGTMSNVQITHWGFAVNCGPAGADSEGGCAGNTFSNINVEAPDTSSADTAIISPFFVGGWSNNLYGSSISGFVGAGQTLFGGQIYSGLGLGGNSIHDNVLGGTRPVLTTLGSDHVFNNSIGGMGLGQQLGTNVSGGIQLSGVGVSPAPVSVTPVTTAGGAAVQYALVCHDFSGGVATPSSFTSTGGAGSGPLAFGGGNGTIVRFPPDSRCQSWDVLIGDTAHAVVTGYIPATAVGSNYYVDAVGVGAAYTAPTLDTTGGINQGNPNNTSYFHALSATSLQATLQQLTVATLPTYAQVVIADSPGVYIRRGEASGNFADSSGNGNTVTAGNHITYSVAGAIQDDTNTSVTLDGSQTTVSTTACSTNCPSGDTITLEAWRKFANVPSAQEDLINQKTSGASLVRNATGFIVFGKNGVGAALQTSNVAITDTTTWHHIVATKDGTASNIYIDSVNVSGGGTNATLAPADATVYFDVAADGSSFPFTGGTDEDAVYKTALSAGQVLAHYHEGLAAKLGRLRYTTDRSCVQAYIAGSWKAMDCGLHTVAGLPTCDPTVPGAGAVVTNNVACAYGATPVATATAYVDCPVFCDGTQSKWLIH